MPHKIERLAVIGRDAVCYDSGAVVASGITLILFPAIVRIFKGNAAHVFVTMSLGKHTCCRNAHHLAITLDYGGERNVAIWNKTIAIDEDVSALSHFDKKTSTQTVSQLVEDIQQNGDTITQILNNLINLSEKEEDLEEKGGKL